MIYLKRPDSEQYRVCIRMILGGSFYFFKDLFDPVTLGDFTDLMIQSVGIVGFMDHLFAQRFDANRVFLERCYKKDPTSFLAQIYQLMVGYFQELDKQINVAHFDGVFKHYTLKKFYQEIFHICNVEPAENVYDFLINHATSISCIATVWTLVLNVLYTLFVPENCLARIVVGKFDNDPKNLKLYMEILNDHLDELREQPQYDSRTKVGVDLIELRRLQTMIAGMCEAGINRGPDELNVFKQTCDLWVLNMVTAVSQHVGRSVFKGLFMLSETDAGGQGSRYPTRLERALCLAYLPTAQGNICSATSPHQGLALFVGEMGKIMGGGSLDNTPILSDGNELLLYPKLTHMGQQMAHYYMATPALSVEVNRLWKHLTKTAIKLKIFFKENLTDIKRVTGIKYIALVLGGYFQIRLLVDDVRDQCPDARKRGELESFKTSQEMMACKRGLLPLLREPNLIALIKNIVETDIKNEISRAAAEAKVAAAANASTYASDYAAAYAAASGASYNDIITNPAQFVGICFHAVSANSLPYAAAYEAAVNAVSNSLIPRILKILGFLFSIKVKSSSPHSPCQLLRLEDSMLRFKIDAERLSPAIPFTTEILKPTHVIFFQFLMHLN
jgi:hypothetical protein